MIAVTTPMVTVQFAISVESVSPDDVGEWVEIALGSQRGEVCVRFMDWDEACSLNQQFRNIDKATNVLAFPSDQTEILGDLAICVPLALQEALEQGKSISSHLAHLVIHGTLHLCGLDHQSEQEALRMESLESDLMLRLGFPDPYEENG